MKKVLKVFPTLHHASHIAEQFGEKHIFRDTNLTGIQFRIMKEIIVTHGGSVESVSEIDFCAHYTPSNISGLVDRLVKAGYLEREMHPDDRRKYILRASAEGKKEFNRVMKHIEGIAEKFVVRDHGINFAVLADELTKLQNALVSFEKDYEKN